MRSWLGIPLFFGMVSMAMAMLWMVMRAVMAVGGACGSGTTPYEIATPCPEGVPAAMLILLPTAVVGIGGYLWAAAGSHLGSALWLLLCWPALFGSLGLNFLQFGIFPPGSSGGPVISWIFFGVLFLVMGIGPVFLGGGPRGGRNRRRRQRLDREADRTRDSRRHDAEQRLEEVDRLHASGVLDEGQHRDRREAILATMPPDMSVATSRWLRIALHAAGAVAGAAAGVALFNALG